MLLKKTSISLMSTKSIVFGTLFVREILIVDSPFSKNHLCPTSATTKTPVA